MSMPEFSRASFAAATANWQKGSIRRAVFGSIYCFGSKSFTSAASLHLKSAVSKWVIGAIPTVFDLIADQKLSTSFPIGVIAPIPVTTTLVFICLTPVLFLPDWRCNETAKAVLLHSHASINRYYLTGNIACFLRC